MLQLKRIYQLLIVCSLSSVFATIAQYPALETNRTRRPDATLLTYYLKKSPQTGASPLCIILQGSEKQTALPHIQYEQESSQSLYEFLCSKAFESPMHVLLIEKAGIDGVLCNDKEFHQLNTIRQRSQDILHVCNELKNRLGNTWDGSTVIIAQEEGTEVAALTMPYLWRVRKALIIGSRLDYPLNKIIEQNYLKEHAPKTTGVLAKLEDQAQKTYIKGQIALAQNMRSPNLFLLGFSHAYWAVRLDYLPGKDFKKCTCPVLIVNNMFDNQASALQAGKDFAAACAHEHLSNIKVCTYEGLTSELQDNNSHIPQTVLQEITAWFAL